MESKIADINFKVVPEALEDITPFWCQTILHEGSAINKDTTVTAVEIKQITDEKSGSKDGGGLSGSTLVKLIPTYGGNVSGDEPPSMVCKISGNSKRKFNFITRLFLFATKNPLVGAFNRHETAFYQQVAPHLTDTFFKFPKVFFAGLDDKGDSNFARYVVMNKPSRVRSALVMEDLADWKNKAIGTMLTKDEGIMCFRNIAKMHAKFWGDKKKVIAGYLKSSSAQDFDKRSRPAKYNKISAWSRNKFLASPDSIKKKIDHISASDWRTHFSMKIPQNGKLPDWFTLLAEDRKSTMTMDDPMVKEMLGVFTERLPKYNQEYLTEFNQREGETLIHGDFHGGNHMFSVNENENNVVIYDFQCCGHGLACFDVINLLVASIEIANYHEVEEFIKDYYNALVQNGVSDYDWSKFSLDFEMALVERIVGMIRICNMMKPKTMMKFMTAISGEEKVDDVEKTGMEKAFEEAGLMTKPILLLTCLYVKDKENFLIPKQ